MLQLVFDFHPDLQNLLSTLTNPLTELLFLPIMLGCTRAVYRGLDNLVITGRTMDWLNDMQSNIWTFARHGA